MSNIDPSKDAAQEPSTNQTDLFGAPMPAANGVQLPDVLARERAAAAEPEEADPMADDDLFGKRQGPIPNRGGRPKGSKNRRTEDVARYILSNYRDPLTALAQIVSTPIHDLAKLTGMKPVDALDFWRRCAVDLLPYLHKRQPVAIETTGASAGMLTVINLAAPGGAAVAPVLELAPIDPAPAAQKRLDPTVKPVAKASRPTVRD